LIWFKKFKEFQEGVNMTEAGFNEWLEVYGKGWMSKSPDLFLSIFSPDATYAHSPFHREMKGHDDIRQYAERAFIYQEAACSLCMDTRFRPDTGQSFGQLDFRGGKPARVVRCVARRISRGSCTKRQIVG
jgi:hypothetical protein